MDVAGDVRGLSETMDVLAFTAVGIGCVIAVVAWMSFVTPPSSSLSSSV